MGNKADKMAAIKVLWLAPNMNHYKLRFLTHLANESAIELTVLSGTGRSKMGDKELQRETNFDQISLEVSKKDFGRSSLVKEELNRIFKDYDWVMIPVEKKNIFLFNYVLKLRKKFPEVKLFSYNHPVLKSKNGKVTGLDRFLTRWFFKKLDRVVFYTEKSHDWAISQGLIKKEKAFWANNTIDTSEIKKHYNFELPGKDPISVLFIGRLIGSKRIPDLIAYFQCLKSQIPQLKLDIIGDGPERHHIETAIKSDEAINWHIQ